MTEIEIRVWAKLCRARVVKSAGRFGIGRDPLTGATVYAINCDVYGMAGYPFPVANCVNGQLLFD